jgi:hypothetical protein
MVFSREMHGDASNLSFSFGAQAPDWDTRHTATCFLLSLRSHGIQYWVRHLSFFRSPNETSIRTYLKFIAHATSAQRFQSPYLARASQRRPVAPYYLLKAVAACHWQSIRISWVLCEASHVHPILEYFGLTRMVQVQLQIVVRSHHNSLRQSVFL